MSRPALLLDGVLVVASGAAVMGLVRSRLRLEEMVCAALICGLILGSAGCFALSLLIGLGAASVLLTPVIIIGVAAAWGGRGIVKRWRVAWDGAVERFRNRELFGLLVIAGVFAVLAFLIFRRALFVDPANLGLSTGYWMPDWAQHLTTAESFSASANLPPHNPIFSGEPLYYPFLPDFQSAMLLALGGSPGVALAAPQGVLCWAIAMLVVTLAVRLGTRRSAGVVAVFVCFLGGGLGFAGAFSDACENHGQGYAPEQCTLAYVAQHPLDGLAITRDTLHAFPGVVADQQRAYDGLLSPLADKPLPNQQWYTPLLAWWLPQRSLVMGFAGALVVLTLLVAALVQGDAPVADLVLAGVLAGLMPLIHVHTLIALGIIGIGLALFRLRLRWLIAGGVTVLLALPRMLQLATGPKGTADLGNGYPWVEPGWLANNTSLYSGAGWSPDTVARYVAFPNETLTHSLSAWPQALGEAGRLPFNGVFWGFWIANLGVALPLGVLVVVAALMRLLPETAWLPRHARSLGERLCSPFPRDLLHLCLATMPIFLIANFVVFQSWDWDNTKLFVYWYLGVALLIGALCSHWWGAWRRRGGARHAPRPLLDIARGTAATLLLAITVATGTIVMIRFLPGQPACAPGGDSSRCVSGPYVMLSAADRAMDDEILARTAPDSVFLTSRNFNDPVLVGTGRQSVMGYDGWLWSYGIDYRQRASDVETAYRGCGSTPLNACSSVLAILKAYDVGYVEVDSSGGQTPQADATWWAAQGLPVVARSDHIVIYDVRRP